MAYKQRTVVRVLALALLLLSLRFAAADDKKINAGRIIAACANDKINVPNGLCIVHAECDDEFCSCCLVNRLCYRSMDACRRYCGRSPPSSSCSSSPEGIPAATTPAPFPA